MDFAVVYNSTSGHDGAGTHYTFRGVRPVFEWLQDVVNSANFARVSDSGFAANFSASSSSGYGGVRPVFSIVKS